MSSRRWSPSSLLLVVGPGLITAATGVGAGDLATSGFAGSRLGTAILWAVVLGAVLKFALSEGLARWQLATGTTILEGAITRLGPVVSVLFLVYLLPWSFFTGAALISACGLTMHAMLPIGDDETVSRLAWGIIHSGAGVALAWRGSFRLFERVMAICIAVMFTTVIVTALAMRPDLGAVTQGLLVPRIPDLDGGGLTWTIALMGGVGGTLTVICYGYWIREEGRTRPDDLRTCRLDLLVGYGMTALFGIALVIIATGMTLDGRGARLVVALADQLDDALGSGARWVFLVGAWAAVFSSLLGVWQSVPYVFSDFVGIVRTRPERGPRTWSYRIFLVVLATVPVLQVTHPFREVQKCYAVLGAAFIPLLALVLLLLNTRRDWIGDRLRNGALSTTVLVITLLLSALAGVVTLLP